MAKKKLQQGAPNKLIPQKLRAKGDLVDDTTPENYEFSEEFARQNPMKKAANKESQKKGK